MENKNEVKRINSVNTYLKNIFGEKVVKLSIDGGFTCPNRDGSKGVGGCIFCSSEGSGDLASDIPKQMELISSKWPKANKFIAYFQSHTNTYAPTHILEEKYRAALDYPNVVGLAIATRPDCLTMETLDLLEQLNKETFLWVELGLQTIHEKTSTLINRCHPLEDYDWAVKELSKRNIKIVSHLILGLPGETEDMMISSVKHVCKPIDQYGNHIFGIKLHLLNVVKGSLMENMFPDYHSFESPEDYVETVVDLLKIIPWDITIHRLTGDVPRPILMTPPWSYKKRTILNGIAQKMKIENIIQGQDYLSSNRPSL